MQAQARTTTPSRQPSLGVTSRLKVGVTPPLNRRSDVTPKPPEVRFLPIVRRREQPSSCLHTHGQGGGGYPPAILDGVPARQKRPRIAHDGPLVPAVAETLDALQLGPEDAGTAALALMLARTIDNMDDEQRARMVAQTSGQLSRVLETLAARSARRPPVVTPSRRSSVEMDRVTAALVHDEDLAWRRQRRAAKRTAAGG